MSWGEQGQGLGVESQELMPTPSDPLTPGGPSL